MISHYCLPTTQIEKRLPVLTCILFALFSLLLQPVLSPGGEVPLSSAERKAKKQHIEKGIQGYRINIRKLQEGIVLQQAKVQSTEKDARNLIWELEQIDIELLEQLTKLQALEEQMAVQQELIRNKETELQQAVANKEAVKTHLQERIKAFYKMGKVGLANVAFSTESMPQLLSFRDSFSSLLAYDKSLIDTYRQSIVELQKSREALHLERIVLNDFITQETIEQARITETKNEKRTLLE